MSYNIKGFKEGQRGWWVVALGVGLREGRNAASRYKKPYRIRAEQSTVGLKQRQQWEQHDENVITNPQHKGV